jgi:dTDP-4-dehydrorhamnose reductase
LSIRGFIVSGSNKSPVLVGITIFGATGLLGKALIREWKEDDVTGFGSADGDIRDESQVLSLVQRSHPDWIVLAAAYTDVDGCERNPDLEFRERCISHDQ